MNGHLHPTLFGNPVFAGYDVVAVGTNETNKRRPFRLFHLILSANLATQQWYNLRAGKWK